jgi:hypothetical protein
MDIHRQNVEAFRSELEEGLQRSPIPMPDYRTVEPRLLPSTHAVGALDGSDQQMFAVETNPEWGVGIWTTLYVEHSVHAATHEVYREGPSPHLWSDEELLFYHLTINLPNPDKNKHFRNDYHSIRQILSSARATEPPLLKIQRQTQAEGVREEAARERATGEWLALRSVIIRHLPPRSLLLKDGRFNCQIEQSASWVDQMGRQAARNNIRVVAVVKSGTLYAHLSPIMRALACTTHRPFYFPVPSALIEASYHNETYPVRKTLMVGGKDHTDLAGIGALWIAFCPDPVNFKTFVVIEFNLYDLYHYKALAREPRTLRNWHIHHLSGPTHATATGIPHIHTTDLLVHNADLEQLVEPTLSEILWLCEKEIGHFGYPNLLGIAHRDVVLTKKKVDLLRKRYMEILAHSDIVLSDLVSNDFLETPHKLHNIS